MNREQRNGPAAAHLSRMAAIADDAGWAVQGVLCGGPGQPEFAYTVGLFRRHLPELIIFGAPFGAACAVLNDLAGRMCDGARYSHGQVLDDVLGPPSVMLLDVADTTEHLFVAHALAGDCAGDRAVRAWQVVYPDDDGRWPWQPGFAVPDLPLLGLVPEGV